jgi:uncharacterized repeat protein (TIGR03803 family)
MDQQEDMLMTSSPLGGRVFGFLAVAALLAGCRAQSVATGAMPFPGELRSGQQAHPAPASGYKLLYSFNGSPDGFQPVAGLTNVKGVFYGTTDSGGTNNAGTVFKITSSGTESVLYSFKGGNDGKYPYSNLIAINGILYGTTSAGGNPQCSYYGCGTVFAVSTSGKERLVYRFKGGKDGEQPYAGLLWLNGYLYGTTIHGGRGCYSAGCGTVFEVSTSGKERVVYKFKGGSADGEMPEANLVAVNGTLYGTTYAGGSASCGKGLGCGIVFSVSTSGNEGVVHDFTGGAGDGANPQGGLVAKNGTLYGATVLGGPGPCNYGQGYTGCGTVYAVKSKGSEHVLYAFKGGADGIEPRDALVTVNGVFYGTTFSGGSCSEGHCGTIFKVSTSGQETVLYRFKGAPDGLLPSAPLILAGGQLYGTTGDGGSNCSNFAPPGCGTVFRISP